MTTSDLRQHLNEMLQLSTATTIASDLTRDGEASSTSRRSRPFIEVVEDSFENSLADVVDDDDDEEEDGPPPIYFHANDDKNKLNGKLSDNDGGEAAAVSNAEPSNSSPSATPIQKPPTATNELSLAEEMLVYATKATALEKNEQSRREERQVKKVSQFMFCTAFMVLCLEVCCLMLHRVVH